MWAAFSLRSSKDPIYRALLLPQPPNQPRPPHLRFAVACLACVMRSDAHDSDEIAKILFDAGMRLWIVMSEVDNREARTLDTISAVCRSYFKLLSVHSTYSDTRQYCCVIMGS